MPKPGYRISHTCGFEQSFCYLAVVLSLKTRQIVGWRLGTNHSGKLTYVALLDALSKHAAPAHPAQSDQGSEYLSHRHQLLCERLEVRMSCSAKGSSWQNGYMERWFCGLKQELPSPTGLKDWLSSTKPLPCISTTTILNEYTPNLV